MPTEVSPLAGTAYSPVYVDPEQVQMVWDSINSLRIATRVLAAIAALLLALVLVLEILLSRKKPIRPRVVNWQTEPQPPD